MGHCETVQSYKLYQEHSFVKLIRCNNWRIKKLLTEILNIFSRTPLKFKGCIHAKQQYDVTFISGSREKLASIHEFTLVVSCLLFSKRNSLCFQFINIFPLCTFSQRFGPGPPHQYLENKNQETLFDCLRLSGKS